jgi:hypothetical protein
MLRANNGENTKPFISIWQRHATPARHEKGNAGQRETPEA